LPLLASGAFSARAEKPLPLWPLAWWDTGASTAGGDGLAVFGCAGCGAVLTAAVSQVALPTHLSDAYWEALHPPLLEAGTYAVDPEPYGPPW
jgi:hypothetical protein